MRAASESASPARSGREGGPVPPWPSRAPGPRSRGGPELRLSVVGGAADAVPVSVDGGSGGAPKPVTGRIGGHRFELTVWPPGAVPTDAEAIRTECGAWVRLKFV
jgi:hypothetical protein